MKYCPVNRFLPLTVAVMAAALLAPETILLAQAPAAPASAITAAKVISRKMASGRSFVGTVLPMRRSVIGSAVDGRVTEFPLRPGDRVSADGTVAQLLTDTLELEITAAEGEMQLRQHALDELQRSGDTDIAAARLASTEARNKYAEARRKRYEDLYRQGRTVTQEEYELAMAESLEAREAYRGAQAEYKSMTEGARLDQIAQARARVVIADAAINLLKSRLAKHRLRSPFNGFVTKTYTEVGAWLSRGDPAAEIIEIDEVEIEVGVSEQYIPALRPGMSAHVRFDGLPDRIFEQKVTSITPQGDVNTRTFPVRIRIQNEEVNGLPLLRPGMFCSVTIAVEAETEVLLVPKDALVLGGRSILVYVAVEDPQTKGYVAKPMTVAIGAGLGQYIQVLGGLSADDLVVVGGNERLRPNQPIRVAKMATYQE
ncbi:efflux RND transporter periplasmic adaptor subunit [Lignipirellula cremea]|uniref:Multidrug resistance protein MdtA n=1 Tax=Lignipirellula cremea TaxID=2528010 RepID=A0A518DMF7_9BACT|nr:efflux RND transporter periplasmic adaptor subunit [Lignipirellula cremea]QDU93013.1 Multidrug resistance protein MdtA precursor [Lignipirellula cremea]